MDIYEFLVAACLLLLGGCSIFDKHEEKSSSVSAAEQLAELRDSKLEELHAAADAEIGWPSVSDCDGMLWAGLAKAAGATWVNLAAAELASGEIHRRPIPCWTAAEGDVGSKSTVSQDMLTGYLWGLWRSDDLAALQRLAAYGEAHPERVQGVLVGWVMGAPYPAEASRVVMRPNLVGLTGRMLDAMSAGADRRSYESLPALYFQVSEDYERHLMTLGILLQGEATERLRQAGLLDVDEQMLDRLKENAEAFPNDALFAAALGVYTGDMARASELLLDPGYEAPSYVRGNPIYVLVHWLFAADIVLRRNLKEE